MSDARRAQVGVDLDLEDGGVGASVRSLVAEVQRLSQAQNANASATDKMARSTGEAVKGMTSLKNVSSQLGSLLPTLSLGAAVAGMTALGKRSLEVADQIGKLATKTGVSTEALSVFANAASTADVSMNDLEGSLGRLSRFVAEVEKGSKPAANALRSIGLSAADLRGKSLDQVFLTIANALDNYADGAGKAAAVQEIFGRGAGNLLPLLQDLAGDGFAQVEERARKAGMILTEDMTSAAARANDALTNLRNTAAGLGNEMTAEVAPAFATAIEAITEFIQSVPPGMRSAAISFGVGTAAATTFAAALTALAFAGATIGAPLLAVAAVAGVLAGGLFAVASNAGKAHLELKRSFETTAKGIGQARRLTDEYERLGTQIESGTLKGDALRKAQERLREITDRLIEISPEYRDALDRQGDSASTTADRIRRLTEARLADLRAQLEQARVDAASGGLGARADRFLERNLGRWAQAFPPFSAQVARSTALIQALEAAIKSLEEQLDKPGVPAGPTPEELARLEKARLAVRQGAVENESRLTQARLQAEEREAAAAYARGLSGMGEYFAARQRMIAEASASEVRALQAQRAAIAEAPATTEEEQLARRRDLARLDTDLEAARIRRASAERALADEAIREQERLRDAVRAVEDQVRTARGETLQVTLDGIGRQAEAYDRLLRQQGIAEEERARRLREYTDVQAAQARITDLQRQADLVFGEIERQRAALAQLVTIGALSERQAQAALLEFEKQRIPVLEEIVDLLAAQRALITDPAQLAALDALAERIGRVGQEVDRSAKMMAELSEGLEAGLTRNLADFFATGIDGADSLAEAFRDLATSVAASVQRMVAEMIAQMIVMQAFKTALGGFAGGGPVGASRGVLDGGGGLFASGGYVSGPGTATSDSIPARLSAGEYVIRAAAVDHYGVDLMDALNGLRTPPLRVAGVPRYASGGLVHGGAGGGSESLDATIGLEPGLVVSQLRTTAGARAVLQTLERNPRAAKRALGL
jgi:hypothetical protein